MCIQDVRIGRKTFGNMISKSVGATLTPLFAPNPNRRVLILSPHDATTYYVTMSDNGTSQPFLAIQPGTDPVLLTVDEHGDIVTRGLWAYTAAATITVGGYEAEFSADNEV